MALDEFEVSKGVISALQAAAPVTTIVGQRSFRRLPRSVLFPFIRIDRLPSVPFDSYFGSAPTPPRWLWDHTVQLNCHTLKTSEQQAGALLKAACNVLEDISNLSITGATVIMTMPGARFTDFSDVTGNWFGIAEFRIITQET